MVFVELRTSRPMTSEIAMQLGRAAAHLFMRRAGRHQVVISKEHASLRLYVGVGVDLGHLFDGRRRAARGSYADAGDRVSHEESAGGRGCGHFGLAQSLSGQRDQILFSNEGFKLPDEVERASNS